MDIFNTPIAAFGEFIKAPSSPKSTQPRTGVLHKTAPACVNDDDHELLLMVLEHISPRVVLMKRGDKIKAKGLFDPDFWNPLSDPERSYFGKLVVRLVALGLVPLENLGASPKTGNHVVYRRI